MKVCHFVSSVGLGRGDAAVPQQLDDIHAPGVRIMQNGTHEIDGDGDFAHGKGDDNGRAAIVT